MSEIDDLFTDNESTADVARDWDLDESNASSSSDVDESKVVVDRNDTETKMLTFFLNQVAVVASLLQKLNLNSAINELFEAFLKDKGIPYSFPYKRWTDFLKPRYQAEAERLCRVSDSLGNQQKLMDYCIKNDLVDKTKVDENFRLNESQHVAERLRFVMRHLYDLKPTFTSYENLQKVMGVAFRETRPGQWVMKQRRVLDVVVPGLMQRYFPNPTQSKASYARFMDMISGDLLTKHEKRTLCNWVPGATKACADASLDNKYTEADSANEARPIVDRLRNAASSFPIMKSYFDTGKYERPAAPERPRRRSILDRLRGK